MWFWNELSSLAEVSLYVSQSSQALSQTLFLWTGRSAVLPADTRHVSLLQNVQNGSSTQPVPTQSVPQALTPAVKQREHNIDQSPPPNAQVGESSYTSTPAIGLRSMDNLIFHRYQTEDSLTLQDILRKLIFWPILTLLFIMPVHFSSSLLRPGIVEFHKLCQLPDEAYEEGDKAVAW